MSDQSLPEGVERFNYHVSTVGTGAFAKSENGHWVKVTDLPKIIDQAKREERERLREALGSEAIRKVAAKRLRLTDEAVGIAGMPRPSFENNAGAMLTAVAAALCSEVDRGR